MSVVLRKEWRNVCTMVGSGGGHLAKSKYVIRSALRSGGATGHSIVSLALIRASVMCYFWMASCYKSVVGVLHRRGLLPIRSQRWLPEQLISSRLQEPLKLNVWPPFVCNEDQNSESIVAKNQVCFAQVSIPTQACRICHPARRSYVFPES